MEDRVISYKSLLLAITLFNMPPRNERSNIQVYDTIDIQPKKSKTSKGLNEKKKHIQMESIMLRYIDPHMLG